MHCAHGTDVKEKKKEKKKDSFMDEEGRRIIKHIVVWEKT